MKPRLKQTKRLWYCWVKGGVGIIGCGYTPVDAYDDWLLLALGVK